MNIPKERYTLEEAAEFLGVKVHDVRWLIEQGDLPATVVENYLPTSNSLYVECYVKASDLEKFVNNLKSKLDKMFESHQSIPVYGSTVNTVPSKQALLASARGLSLKLMASELSNEQIVTEIDRQFPGLTDAAIGRLFSRQETESYAAVRKRGQRLRGKAK